MSTSLGCIAEYPLPRGIMGLYTKCIVLRDAAHRENNKAIIYYTGIWRFSNPTWVTMLGRAANYGINTSSCRHPGVASNSPKCRQIGQ